MSDEVITNTPIFAGRKGLAHWFYFSFMVCLFLMIRFRRTPQDILTRMEALSHFLMREPSILFAYLFGSLVGKRPMPLTDVDLAVYVREPKKLDYLKLYGEIASLLHTEEIDLVVLNDAPLSLAGRILKNRKVLVDKDPFLRHRYESLTLRKFYDFLMREHHILKQRYGIG